jgi:hypothetical protein
MLVVAGEYEAYVDMTPAAHELFTPNAYHKVLRSGLGRIFVKGKALGRTFVKGKALGRIFVKGKALGRIFVMAQLCHLNEFGSL